MNELFYDHFESPLGMMEVTANRESIVSIYFIEETKPVATNKITDLARIQLLEYFEGDRTVFDLPLSAKGTDFQKQVWRALTNIQYGETCSYSDIANSIDNPKAVRAVGAANGKNPMTIVVPCHRVIGRNGTLTGYAFGVERKSWLLNHESSLLF